MPVPSPIVVKRYAVTRVGQWLVATKYTTLDTKATTKKNIEGNKLPTKIHVPSSDVSKLSLKPIVLTLV
jgi:hypothetical protein